jgi:hypothetical protein
MAYIPEKLFIEVIAPTLRKKDVALIGISTQQSGTNYFSRLMASKYEDETPVLKVINIQGVCAPCREKKMEASCQHLKSQTPPWLDSDNEYINIITGSSKVSNREIYNILDDDDIYPFYTAECYSPLRYFEKTAVPLTPIPHQNVVFIAIDPALGSKQSDIAAMAWIFTDVACTKIMVRIFYLFI